MAACDWDVTVYKELATTIFGDLKERAMFMDDGSPSVKIGTAVGTCHLKGAPLAGDCPFCEEDLTFTARGGYFIRTTNPAKKNKCVNGDVCCSILPASANEFNNLFNCTNKQGVIGSLFDWDFSKHRRSRELLKTHSTEAAQQAAAVTRFSRVTPDNTAAAFSEPLATAFARVELLLDFASELLTAPIYARGMQVGVNEV